MIDHIDNVNTSAAEELATDKQFGISSFGLKLAAILGMTCNHIANVFAADLPTEIMLALYSLGGLTFPIMSFFLVEGYRHTSNLRKYALRLGAFAVVAQIPYSLLWGAVPNVLWTLLVSLGLLWAYDNLKQRALFWLIAAGAFFATASFDWGGLGPVMTLMFYLLRERRAGIALTMLIALIANMYPVAESLIALQSAAYHSAEAFLSLLDLDRETTAPLIPYAGAENEILQAGLYVTLLGIIGYSVLGFGLAAVLLYLYNGRRGRPLKWFFYCYYPAHLALIWLTSLLL